MSTGAVEIERSAVRASRVSTSAHRIPNERRWRSQVLTGIQCDACYKKKVCCLSIRYLNSLAVWIVNTDSPTRSSAIEENNAKIAYMVG